MGQKYNGTKILRAKKYTYCGQYIIVQKDNSLKTHVNC